MKTILCTHYGAWVNQCKGKTFLQVGVVREALGKKNFHIHANHLTQFDDGKAIVHIDDKLEPRKVALKIKRGAQ